MKHLFHFVAVLFALVFMASQASASTFVTVDSEPGDYIGGGVSATYPAVAASGSADHRYVYFSAGGYTYEFESASGELVAGTHEGAIRYPFNPDGTAGLAVSGNGRGCNSLTGRFIIHELEFGVGNAVTKAAIDYEQHCDGRAPAMFGYIRFNSDVGMLDSDGDGFFDIEDNCSNIANADQLDGDGDRLGNVCDPIQGPVFVRIESQSGDYIGMGASAIFAAVTASAYTDHSYVKFSAGGYTYEFESPSGALAVGVYDGATRYPFNAVGTAGLDVYGNGRGCNTLTGRFVVHELVFGAGTKVERAAIDFEQHCEGAVPAMFGYIRVNSDVMIPDADGDGQADAYDQDDDNDGVPDAQDADPLDASVAVFRLDGIYKGSSINERAFAQ